MKIYDKTPADIYRLLPAPYKAVMIAAGLFFAFMFLHFLFMAVAGKAENAAEPLPIAGLGWEISIYDPALDADPATGTAWLAFSNIRRMPPMPGPPRAHVPFHHSRGGTTSTEQDFAPGIRMASANLPCERWVMSSSDLMPARDEITAPDGLTTIAAGIWRYETPALVFDPGDTGREWKRWAYKYMWTSKGNVAAARRYGVIIYQHTHDPGRGWSPEEWAFSPAPDYPPPPYQNMVQNHLDALDPSLADVTVYARPSVVAYKGALVMTLSAFTDGGTPDRVVMFLSYDHGASWKFAGDVLKVSEAPKLGPYTTLGGATLLKQGAHLYLAAVFGDGKVAGLGTSIFGFEDVATGKLRRDGSGVPVLLNTLPRNSLAPTTIGGGYAAYSDACAGGMLTGEFSGLKRMFQVFTTHRKPVGE